MLRVAVNGFMESLGVVLGVMERLDVDVLAPPTSHSNANTGAGAGAGAASGSEADGRGG